MSAVWRRRARPLADVWTAGLVALLFAGPATLSAQTFRTFEIAKPAPLEGPRRSSRAIDQSATPPAHRESMRTTVGLGYVEGADWGAEIAASGGFAGAQVHFDALVTQAGRSLLLDQGSIAVLEPTVGWRLDAGDVFSHLRGASRGLRLSWRARGNRRPAIALYTPRWGVSNQRTVVTYRDQLQSKGQTLLDAELASDLSYLLRSRLTGPRLELEVTVRSQAEPVRTHDGSISASARIWRGLSVGAGRFRAVAPGDRNSWTLVSIRFPIARFVDFSVERTIASTPGTFHSTMAVMTNVTAGDLRFFHRQQYGHYDFLNNYSLASIERQQTQSMTTYSPRSWLNLTLQLATQRTDSGQLQHWEELQTAVKVTRTTALRLVTAVPDFANVERFQASLRQDLPRRFALQADFGRISAFRAVPRELDRRRFKIMLFKTFDIATPARGGHVSGRVVDHSGRGIAGARLNLGCFSADTDSTGRYLFEHVPPGSYELSLNQQLLPADYAWDGREVRLAVKGGQRHHAELRVAPLNAIHGRVYADRNGNGRFDAKEGVAGAVLQLGDRLTATDTDGAYSFFNLWPNAYVVRVHSLPAMLELTNTHERAVELRDDGPVRHTDFTVTARTKPIIWKKDP